MPVDIEFRPWPKIARLNRDIIITEKIDGTNAAIHIDEEGYVTAQSRTRILDPGVKGGDNFGFATWALSKQRELAYALGPGVHFGEWWGSGIKRGYGLEDDDKRFSLFNVRRFHSLPFSEYDLLNVATVPVLYQGNFTEPSDDPVTPWDEALFMLREFGSLAVPGFMKPEGIVVFHTASSTMYKVTLDGDEVPKGYAQSS